MVIEMNWTHQDDLCAIMRGEASVFDAEDRFASYAIEGKEI